MKHSVRPLMRQMVPMALLAVHVAFCPPETRGGERLDRLTVLEGNWPRAFFFRMSEGMAANPRIDFETFEAQMSRLSGIEGKCLDEEIPGRSRRNIDMFTRFKQAHSNQLVLLHYNGNARDPRDGIEEYHAAHWLYYTGAAVTADVPPTHGESQIAVTDATLFRTDIGRYGNRHEDIGLCLLDNHGRPDWDHAEQVQLIEVDADRNVLRVKRACYGTEPLALHAGQAYAAAHVTEGPWGKNNHLMWYYNYSLACPRDQHGRQAVDCLIDEISGEFAPDGRLHAFDGIQFDVLHHEHARFRHNRGRGVDTDGDGQADGGVVRGINAYGAGVSRFARLLRERLGDDRLLLADGHSAHHQRAVDSFNGIESEGWPSLGDAKISDWSGGLNRHRYWAAFGQTPAFSYINHKFLEKGKPCRNLPFSTHRLVMAAALFTDAAITYSLRPPRGNGDWVPVWDELWKGTEHELGWLGQPLGDAVHLAEHRPLLPDFTITDIRKHLVTKHELAATKAGIHLSSTARERIARLTVTIRDVPCNGPDLFVALTTSGAPMHGYPQTMPRLLWCGIAPSDKLLISPLPPTDTGMRIRGRDEEPIDPDSGATVRFQADRIVGGEARNAYFCHPPWRPGGTGATFWQQTRRIPPESALKFAIGMGALSPERSDGVLFRVLARRSRSDAWTTLFETQYNEFRWKPCAVDLTDWEGETVTLRFVTDCGPDDNSTTDHAAWADARLVPVGRKEAITQPVQFMSFVGRTPFKSRFAFRHIQSPTVDLEVTIEGGSPAVIHDIRIHHGPDVVGRAYEHGLVVANPSDHRVTLDLEKVAPGRRFRRLRGSTGQDTQTNNGQLVRPPLTLDERDALFLVEEKGHAGDIPNTDNGAALERNP